MVVTACIHEETIESAGDGTGGSIGTCKKCGQVKQYPGDGRKKAIIVKEGTPPARGPKQPRGRPPKNPKLRVPLQPLADTPIHPRSPLEIQAAIEAMQLVENMLKPADGIAVGAYLEGGIKTLQWVLGNKH